eukprot:TRINITY_DN590_c0_g1_i2.p1 TRINITY_DN590_c0_g1~~TRINITY_DN590_c0_g1_i2.p1  ORF type:complete len:149 (-),score=44.00 TRINITY_DN590_c0_g1_i2:380-826(-)
MASFLDSVRLQPAHGYVAGVAIASVFVNTWAAFGVGAARKKYNVPYPQMYAETSHAHSTQFNCVQRAHQNILENYPPFLMLLAVGSTYRPALAAAFGALRLFGFISYYKGYSSGDPKKRLNPGTAVGYIGLFGLLGLGFEVVARLITS